MSTLLLLLACAAKDPAPATAAEAPSEPPPAAEPAVPEPLPTPFTAEQIAAAFQPGQHLVFSIASAGKPTVIADWQVTGWTEDEVTIAFTTSAEDRTTVLEPTEERTTRWDELVQHAHFPEPGASRARGVLVHPLGTLEIWLYTVPGPEEGLIRRYWFADDLPGPPIRFTITAEGAEIFKAEGAEIFKMEQLERAVR